MGLWSRYRTRLALTTIVLVAVGFAAGVDLGTQWAGVELGYGVFLALSVVLSVSALFVAVAVALVAFVRDSWVRPAL